MLYFIFIDVSHIGGLLFGVKDDLQVRFLVRGAGSLLVYTVSGVSRSLEVLNIYAKGIRGGPNVVEPHTLMAPMAYGFDS